MRALYASLLKDVDGQQWKRDKTSYETGPTGPKQVKKKNNTPPREGGTSVKMRLH